MIAHSAYLSTINIKDAFNLSWDFLQKGGIFMIPLALTSIVGLTAILFKFLSLSRGRIIPDALAVIVINFEQHVIDGTIEPILKEFQRGESTLARLCAVAFKYRGRPRSEIIHAVETSSREESVQMHSGIGLLDTVITIAPLLGLLGTASGLVLIFKGLGDNSDHLAIARGIAEALRTTIFGLAIAVPCIVAHGHFTRRIETLTMRLETLLSHLAAACEKITPNT